MDTETVKVGDLTITVKLITYLESLEVSYDRNDSDSYNIANQVAFVVTDWNGQGTVDPLYLVGNRKLHRAVMKVSNFINKKREVEKATFEELENEIVVTWKNGIYSVKDITVLEFFEYMSSEKLTESDLSRAEFKCVVLSDLVMNWNGKGKLSSQELYDNRNMHDAVIAVDRALGEFFRFDEMPDKIEASTTRIDTDHEHEPRTVSESESSVSFRVTT